MTLRMCNNINCVVLHCVADQPKNFTAANVTSRSATLLFMETFDVGLSTFKPPAIDYNISCVDANGSAVLAASINDTQETKIVPVNDLRPFTEYSCRLVKIVGWDTRSTTVIRPIGLRFRTAEDGECVHVCRVSMHGGCMYVRTYVVHTLYIHSILSNGTCEYQSAGNNEPRLARRTKMV